MIAFVLKDEMPSSVSHYADELDDVHVLGAIAFPARRPGAIVFMFRRLVALRRTVRRLGLGPRDVLVAYSFREFALNALIRALRARPTLVRIRKCDHDSELTYTRHRTLLSLYYNLWNTLFGTSRLRYRWLPTTNRAGAGSFVHDPYDAEFCVGPPGAPAGAGRWVPYPFAALVDGAHAVERRTVVVLGELYPLHESLDAAAFRERFNEVLASIRATLPDHRLVFKPRVPVDGMGFDLEGYEIGFEHELLEDMLVRAPEIERVVSVKSSGSAFASLYGRQAYLLYPMFDFPSDFRASVDAYFAPYRDIVCFVSSLADLGRGRRVAIDVDKVELDAEPLLQILGGAVAPSTLARS
jgi:hypothetical protein